MEGGAPQDKRKARSAKAELVVTRRKGKAGLDTDITQEDDAVELDEDPHITKLHVAEEMSKASKIESRASQRKQKAQASKSEIGAVRRSRELENAKHDVDRSHRVHQKKPTQRNEADEVSAAALGKWADNEDEWGYVGPAVGGTVGSDYKDRSYGGSQKEHTDRFEDELGTRSSVHTGKYEPVQDVRDEQFESDDIVKRSQAAKRFDGDGDEDFAVDIDSDEKSNKDREDEESTKTDKKGKASHASGKASAGRKRSKSNRVPS